MLVDCAIGKQKYAAEYLDHDYKQSKHFSAPTLHTGKIQTSIDRENPSGGLERMSQDWKSHGVK